MVTELDHYKPNFKIQAARIRGHADYAGVALRPLGGLFGPPAAADRRTNIPGQPDNVPRSTRNNEKLSLLHDASQICCRELGLVRGAALQRARMLPGKPLGFHMPEPVQGLLHSVRLHKGSLEERGTVVFRVGLSLECGVRGARPSGAITSGERGGRPTPSHREAPRTPAHGNSRYPQLRTPTPRLPALCVSQHLTQLTLSRRKVGSCRRVCLEWSGEEAARRGHARVCWRGRGGGG